MSCSRICHVSGLPAPEGNELMSDEEFARAFAKGDLEPETFGHAAHLRLAWILVKRHGLEKATGLLCAQIERFDRLHGKGLKFNKEVTVASARLVWKILKDSNATGFREFLYQNPLLLTDFRLLLGPYMQKQN